MSLTDSAEGLSLSTLMDNPTMLIVVGLVIFVILFIIVFVVALFAGKRKASSGKRKSGKIELNPADFPDADFNKAGNGIEGGNADSSSAIAFTPVSSSPVSSSAPARESPAAQEVPSPASAGVASQPRRQRAVDDDDDFVYVSSSRNADAASAGTGAAGVSSSFRQTSQPGPAQNQAAQPQNSPFRAQPYPQEQPASSPFRASDAAVSSAIAATAVAAAASDDDSGVEVYDNNASEPIPQEQPAYAQPAQPAYAPLPEDPFMRPSQAPADDEGVEILGEKPAVAPAPSARTRRSADAFFVDRKKKEPVKEPEPLFEDEPSGLYIKPNEPADDPFANAYERPRRPAFDELRLNRAAAPAAVGVAAEAVAFSNESEPEAEFAEVCSSEENAPFAPENEIADEFAAEVADEAVFERAPAAGFSVAAAPVVVDDATETGMGETIVAPVDTESSRCENMDGGVEMWKENKPETHESGNGGKYAFYDSVIREENEKRANAEFEAIGATPEDRFAAVAESIHSEEAGNEAEISEEPKSVFGKPEDGTSDPDY